VIGTVVHDTMPDRCQAVVARMIVGEFQQCMEGKIETGRQTHFGQHRSRRIARGHVRSRVQVLDFAPHCGREVVSGVEQGEFHAGGARAQAQDRTLHAATSAGAGFFVRRRKSRPGRGVAMVVVGAVAAWAV
jgi:hypothetical protein